MRARGKADLYRSRSLFLSPSFFYGYFLNFISAATATLTSTQAVDNFAGAVAAFAVLFFNFARRNFTKYISKAATTTITTLKTQAAATKTRKVSIKTDLIM